MENCSMIREMNLVKMRKRKKKIASLQRYDGQIAKTQSWNPLHINIIKNFINHKNNNYIIEGLFFEQDGENGWGEL